MLRRLGPLLGICGRCNEALAAGSPHANRLLIFFPGDVQDFASTMEASPDSRRYTRWSLEATAEALAARFPDTLVLVLRAAELTEPKGYAVYRHFAAVDDMGVPLASDSEEPDAWAQLQALVESARAQLATPQPPAAGSSPLVLAARAQLCGQSDPADSSLVQAARAQLGRQEPVAGDPTPVDAALARLCAEPLPRQSPGLDTEPVSQAQRVTLVAFSKGSVVLRALVRQADSQSGQQLKASVGALYWLDAGNGGSGDVWPTEAAELSRLLEALPRLRHVHIHVTPYQVSDPRRPWIGQEEAQFHGLLLSSRLRVHRHLHFAAQAPTLLNHFRLLDCFPA